MSAIQRSYPVFPPGAFIAAYRPFTDNGRVILGVRRFSSSHSRLTIFFSKIMHDAKKSNTPPSSRRHLSSCPNNKKTG